MANIEELPEEVKLADPESDPKLNITKKLLLGG